MKLDWLNSSARWLVVSTALIACAGAQAEGPRGGEDERLAQVSAVHGGAGPWAVAGYRMGEFALHELGLPRGSFDVEVVHYTPREVQYSCMADGSAAATGASLGRLNLTLAEASVADTRTLYRNKATGRSVVLHVTPAFRARYLDVPREQLGAAGREVMALPDSQIFEIVPP